MKPNKGNLLIAEPSIIGDISFNRSVILIAEENESGFVGFILNKPLDYTINDLIPEIKSSMPVFHGGPVEQDNLYFIHQVPHLIPNSIEISNGIFWGGDFETVSWMLQSNVLSEQDIRFFLGYSGWNTHQLESELSSNNWLITNNTHQNNFFSKNNKTFWKDKMKEFGGDYLLWSNAPENPNLN